MGQGVKVRDEAVETGAEGVLEACGVPGVSWVAVAGAVSDAGASVPVSAQVGVTVEIRLVNQ